MRSRLLYVFLFVVIVSGLYLAERYIDSNNITLNPEVSETTSLKIVGEQLLPESTTRTIISHQFYTLSYVESHEQAEWVAYELRPEHISDQNHSRPNFEMDPKVRSRSAHWNNYKGSGYDRGHLCPAGDRRFSSQAYEETFFTSNISPQNHDFNSGIWNRLEQKVRRWTEDKGALYVIVGGVLRNELHAIGREAVSVPEAFYKIVLATDGESYKVIAFLIPNQPSSRSYFDYTVSVDALEAVTGIDFFPKLTDSIEHPLEATVATTWWQ
ncbi:DNA/RNA non-specific endonuclease [Altibacter sp. HG106]|uniref:DNA/RNA non-specific endonuclease n=1 Tax=Altibacter sp. HG106 TaxID=3023937 RepID=UPI002350BCAC|nr:DNA/RNA non-specific endonuclease [Altibacter sp. HG106]MDC7994286.1 DNA/RNA non-specific endonuclease [Altibacter sp. HG106]